MSKIIRNSLFIAALAGLASLSSAQWTGVVIHPGGSFSAATGASSGIAVGRAGTFLSEAGYWTNSGSTYTSVHQPGFTSSGLYAGDLNMQVGGVQNPGNVHAARWFGTAASFEDMNPARFSHSEANAMFGKKMAGWAQGPGFNGNRAILWNGGNAEDYTDLTPDGQYQAAISAMDANQQVGGVTDADLNVSAGLWTGTANSFVNLGPAGSTSSYAFAVANGRQGGAASIGLTQAHAYLWSGTSASGLDIHPDVAISSQINGMSSNFQVGRTYMAVGQTGKYHAALWSGTSNSWVDLHSFLPSEFQISEATSIVEYADRVEIYGYAQREFLGDDSIAVMWTQPVPEPGSVLAVVVGLVGLARLRRKSK